jgi:uncharacterized phage protein (TIGR02220 family)
MAKELPYFKFEPAEYLTKNISFCSISAQGLFINICSYYWQRNCKLTTEQVLKRLNYKEELKELISEGIIDLVEDFIVIKFLDNQLVEVEKTSKQNSTNGAKGGRPKKPIESENKPTALIPLSETKGIREDKIKEDKINNNLNPINWDALLNFFNTTTNKKCRVVSTKARNQFNARLKEKFTKEDIFKAIKNCYNDEWHIKNNHQYLTLEFISRADKLDKFSQIAIDTGKTNQKFMTYDN